MSGFNDPDFNLRNRLAKVERRLDDLTIEDIWQPIVSCSTSDNIAVELRLTKGDNCRGHFDAAKGRWLMQTDLGHGPMPEGIYPTHWRKVRR